MKTAGRENPNRWVTEPGTRVHGADVQNRSRSISWSGKQEKLGPQERCFFLTSTFIELHRTWLRHRRSHCAFLTSLAIVMDFAQNLAVLQRVFSQSGLMQKAEVTQRQVCSRPIGTVQF